MAGKKFRADGGEILILWIVCLAIDLRAVLARAPQRECFKKTDWGEMVLVECWGFLRAQFLQQAGQLLRIE